MNEISLLITGQIRSRAGSRDLNFELSKSNKILKSLNSKNEIVLSTYKCEIEGIDKKNYDKLIINDDPGPDFYRVSPWPIGRNINRFSTNYSRMFSTTVSGLKACQNEIVIKTRIELIPSESIKFEKWIENICEQIKTSSLPRIAFLSEHYNGVIFSIDGTIGTIPDTIQISRKDVLLEIWLTSQKFWHDNFRSLTRKTILFPITSEQIVGLNYLSLYCNFSMTKELKKLRRYYFSRQLVKAVVKSENSYFIWTKYKDSGLSLNRFKGTYEIVTPNFIKINSSTQLLKRIAVVKIKKHYHILRRYINSLRKLNNP